MANAWYDFGLQQFAGGDTSWDTSDIRVVLADGADYTPNLATDDFLSDVAAGALVAVSSSFGSKTLTGGYLDAADVVLTSVTGDQSELLVIYNHDGGSDAARPLLLKFDTATGLPVTPDGGNITIQWDNSTPKIARL